jgi:hypothetical protein
LNCKGDKGDSCDPTLAREKHAHQNGAPGFVVVTGVSERGSEMGQVCS